MKLLRKFKPSKLLGTVPMRPDMHGAMVFTEKVKERDGLNNGEVELDHNVLYATNGSAIARIDLGRQRDWGDESGPIPAPALRHLEKGVAGSIDGDAIRVGTITSYERRLSETHATARDFPAVQAIWEEKCVEPPPSRRLTVTLDPKLFGDLVAAIDQANNGAVTITFDMEGFTNYDEDGKGRWYQGAMVIEPNLPQLSGQKATGLLMPVRPVGG